MRRECEHKSYFSRYSLAKLLGMYDLEIKEFVGLQLATQQGLLENSYAKGGAQVLYENLRTAFLFNVVSIEARL